MPTITFPKGFRGHPPGGTTTCSLAEYEEFLKANPNVEHETSSLEHEQAAANARKEAEAATAKAKAAEQKASEMEREVAPPSDKPPKPLAQRKRKNQPAE